jgi:putative endonuclease
MKKKKGTSMIKQHFDSDCNYDKFYVYVLLCCSGEPPYYVGQTAHLVSRIYSHISGVGAYFTQKHLPCELIHLEVFPNRTESLRREKELIRLNFVNFIIGLRRMRHVQTGI